MMYGNHMSTGGWIMSIVGTLIVLALIIGTVVWLASNRTSGQADMSAGEILDRRLAGGEITAEQYHGLRESLSPTAPVSPRPASPGTPG